MRYRQPFDKTDPDASYQNANPALGLRGSILDIIAVEAMQREMTEDSKTESNPMQIRIPNIQTVLATQDFNLQERSWIFCLMGRMLYKVGEHDTWGVFPYFLGLAGTGKSTLLRLTASLFEACDVGYLSNTLQKTFSLEGICESLVYFALDIDKEFGLDQAIFQSMVVGEEVSVLRKFKRPLTIVWQSHGSFAGNSLPSGYLFDVLRVCLPVFSVPNIFCCFLLFFLQVGKIKAVIWPED